MYVCMYVFMYVLMYVCMYVFTYVYMYIHIDTSRAVLEGQELRHAHARALTQVKIKLITKMSLKKILGA